MTDFLDIELSKKTQRVEQLEKKVKRLQSKTSYQATKICKLSDLLTELRQKDLLEKEPAALIEKSFDGTLLDIFNHELANQGKSTHARRYSQAIKQFALTLHYYSPQAYEFCRTVFTLPDVSSLRNWLAGSDEGPGFLAKVLQAYKQYEPNNLDCSLVIDSMALHKQTLYKNGKYVGFVDYGGLIAEDTEKLASEALVFLLVPLKNSGRQYPVGYFFVDKVNATVQTNLVRTLLELSADLGIRIRNITSDGASCNQSMYSMLGCDLNPKNPRPWFNHLRFGYKVYATLDICHMLKLARNAHAELHTFHSKTGVIQWEYIELLAKLQNELQLRLGNKLANAHVEWQKAKMKVRLAAQTYSTAVADSLQFLSQYDERFQDVADTIRFIREVCISFPSQTFPAGLSFHFH